MPGSALGRGGRTVTSVIEGDADRGDCVTELEGVKEEGGGVGERDGDNGGELIHVSVDESGDESLGGPPGGYSSILMRLKSSEWGEERKDMLSESDDGSVSEGAILGGVNERTDMSLGIGDLGPDGVLLPTERSFNGTGGGCSLFRKKSPRSISSSSIRRMWSFSS